MNPVSSAYPGHTKRARRLDIDDVEPGHILRLRNLKEILKDPVTCTQLQSQRYLDLGTLGHPVLVQDSEWRDDDLTISVYPITTLSANGTSLSVSERFPDQKDKWTSYIAIWPTKPPSDSGTFCLRLSANRQLAKESYVNIRMLYDVDISLLKLYSDEQSSDHYRLPDKDSISLGRAVEHLSSCRITLPAHNDDGNQEDLAAISDAESDVDIMTFEDNHRSDLASFADALSVQGIHPAEYEHVAVRVLSDPRDLCTVQSWLAEIHQMRFEVPAQVLLVASRTLYSALKLNYLSSSWILKALQKVSRRLKLYFKLPRQSNAIGTTAMDDSFRAGALYLPFEDLTIESAYEDALTFIEASKNCFQEMPTLQDFQDREGEGTNPSPITIHQQRVWLFVDAFFDSTLNKESSITLAAVGLLIAALDATFGSRENKERRALMLSYFYEWDITVSSSATDESIIVQNANRFVEQIARSDLVEEYCAEAQLWIDEINRTDRYGDISQPLQDLLQCQSSSSDPTEIQQRRLLAISVAQGL